ncbi:hypothetical protein CPT_Slocum_030 [Serratia phage Slocum]|nr:hypothetical protein CPT_Slocum_030 [Serratia phage Slocum]
MDNKEKLEQLRQLIKSANQCKMSELSELQQHAVLLFGATFPASRINGKLQHDKTSKQTAISPLYKEFNDIKKFYNVTVTGLNAKSSWVEVDTLPEFKTVQSIRTALDAYPRELLIPYRALDMNFYKEEEPTLTTEDIYKAIADLAYQVHTKNFKDAFIPLTLHNQRLTLAISDFWPGLSLTIPKLECTPQYQTKPTVHPDPYINAIAWASLDIQVNPKI